MKQKGRCIVGDPIQVDNYTSDWVSVRLHPATFYRRHDEFQEGFKNVKGFYAELDLGQFVIIRFSEKDDMTAFHRMHHEYV
jgi:hypothetical protein